jgi:hypothetical protein
VGLIDHAMHREGNPAWKPTGYFRSMLRKADSGELHRYQSIFGTLKRGRGQREIWAPGYRGIVCMGGLGVMGEE